MSRPPRGTGFTGARRIDVPKLTPPPAPVAEVPAEEPQRRKSLRELLENRGQRKSMPLCDT
jgi:hypothetical protein